DLRPGARRSRHPIPGALTSIAFRAARTSRQDAFSLEVRPESAAHGLALRRPVALFERLEGSRQVRVDVKAVELPRCQDRYNILQHIYVCQVCMTRSACAKDPCL